VLPSTLEPATSDDVRKREYAVPFVNVKVIEGVFDSEQKQEMVRRVTDTMVEIEGDNMRQVTWVVVEEVKSGD
jgi:4-oxalocrotonate tautomerase